MRLAAPRLDGGCNGILVDVGQSGLAGRIRLERTSRGDSVCGAMLQKVLLVHSFSPPCRPRTFA